MSSSESEEEASTERADTKEEKDGRVGQNRAHLYSPGNRILRHRRLPLPLGFVAMKLNEIVAGFDAFEAAIEANQGELTPELAETLDALHLAEKTKVDGLVFYLKALQGEADALAKLGDEIYAKRQAKLAKKESLMRYVRWYMEQRQAEKLAGEVFRFQLCKSGKPPVEVLVPPEELPEHWVKVAIAPDKDAIRRDLEDSGVPPNAPMRMLARLGEASLSLRIF